MSETVTLNMASVEIKRDATMSIPLDVLEHEVPVLQLVHGEDNVKVTNTFEVDVENFTIEGEYERLVRKYEKSDNAARKVYGGDPRQLAEQLDMSFVRPTGASKTTKVVESMQVHGDEETESVPEPTIVRRAKKKAPGGAEKTAAAKPKPGRKVKA